MKCRYTRHIGTRSCNLLKDGLLYINCNTDIQQYLRMNIVYTQIVKIFCQQAAPKHLDNNAVRIMTRSQELQLFQTRNYWPWCSVFDFRLTSPICFLVNWANVFSWIVWQGKPFLFSVIHELCAKRQQMYSQVSGLQGNQPGRVGGFLIFVWGQVVVVQIISECCRNICTHISSLFG